MSNFTMSSTAKKATRKAAYDLIIKLKQGEALNDNQLDSLLLYFAPSIGKRAKTAIEWVAKAAGSNDVRFYLNYIRVQDGFAYATGGHRIHKAASDLPTGYYCPKTFAQIDDVTGNYPDTDKIMTRLKDAEIITAKLSELSKGISAKVNYLKLELPEIAVQESYLIDAVNGEDDTTIIFEPYNSSHRIHGESEFGAFVIMPMRL